MQAHEPYVMCARAGCGGRVDPQNPVINNGMVFCSAPCSYGEHVPPVNRFELQPLT